MEKQGFVLDVCVYLDTDGDEDKAFAIAQAIADAAMATHEGIVVDAQVNEPAFGGTACTLAYDPDGGVSIL